MTRVRPAKHLTKDISRNAPQKVQRRILQCMYGTSFTRITQRCSRTVTVVLDNDHLGFDLKQRNCLLPSCIATKHITFRDVRVFRPGKYGLLCRLSSVTDDQCFSIILSTGKTLFFLADSPESVKTWVSTGNYLKSVFNNMSLALQREIWMWEFFKIADKNGDGKITLTEIKRLFKKINLQLEEYYIKECFTEHDADNNKNLSFDEFVHFYDELTKRPELLEIFENYAIENTGNEKGTLTCNDLLSFLTECQGHTHATVIDAKKIIDDYEPCQSIRESSEMSTDGFLLMINSGPGQMFNPDHKKVYQDMTRPFSEYFVSSSHNTYLTDGQLRGESSTTAYLNALQRGCKCVELDCWDGNDGEPIIYHGYTLTTKIKFKDVIRTINDYAFNISEYPVVLSIENHCTVKQQKRMAEIMKIVFGEKLLICPVLSEGVLLPSPEDLKGKIIVKGKSFASPFSKKQHKHYTDRMDDNRAHDNRPHTHMPKSRTSVRKTMDSNNAKDYDDDAYDVSEEDEAAEAADGAGEHWHNAMDNVRIDVLHHDNHGENEEKRRLKKMNSVNTTELGNKQVSNVAPVGKPHKKLKLSVQLSKLVVYFKSERFAGFDNPCPKFYAISSFNEAKGKHLMNKCDYKKVQAYHNLTVSRVYPAGSRTNSSNFDPCEFWNYGAQMVAINFQTPGAERDVYLARFQQNGNCGYVLKPDCIRYPETYSFDPLNVKDYNKGVKLTVTVITGQQLPKPKSELKGEVVDPFVRIDIYGIDDDRQTKETQWIKDNGFNPRWDETLVFYLKMPEVAMIRFSVWDKDVFSADDFLGQHSLPFESISEGYRHAILEDENGKSLQPASIFLKIKTEHIMNSEVVPNKHYRISSSTSRKSDSTRASVEQGRNTRRFSTKSKQTSSARNSQLNSKQQSTLTENSTLAENIEL